MGVFVIERTTGFSREFRKLMKRHPDLVECYEKALSALASDPYNLGQLHNILKLFHIPVGDGQYRIRLRRWRFRYDIIGKQVILKYCCLRREDTYRA